MRALDWVDRSDGKSRGLLVFVMHFMEMFVQEGKMIYPMQPIRCVILGL